MPDAIDHLILAGLAVVNLAGLSYLMGHVDRLRKRAREHEKLTGLLLMGMFDSPERARDELAKRDQGDE